MHMKRKWKWLILLCIAVLCFAVWILTVGGRQIPVYVIGELSEKEVTEIVAAAKRELRQDIFPNFSWQSLKDVPAAIRRYSSIKLITVSVVHTNAAWVFLWHSTNGVTSFSSKTNYFELRWFEKENERGAFHNYRKQAGTSPYELIFFYRTNGWQCIGHLP